MDQVKINSVDMRVQIGDTACGVLVIDVATSFAYGNDPAKLTFQQENLVFFSVQFHDCIAIGSSNPNSTFFQ